MRSNHGDDADPTLHHCVSSDDEGCRLDLFLASRHPDLSRSRIKRAVEDGRVQVNSKTVKAGHRLRFGDRIFFRQELPREWIVEAEAIPLSIVFEDESIIVIDKPAGMVVHPGAGNRRGTLAAGLLFHCADLSGVGGVLRPGIVHRLDKNTSGVMVAAKNDAVHRALARQFKERTVRKRYQAIVAGIMPAGEGVAEMPVGRHRKDRKKMSASGGSRARDALSRWKVVREFGSKASLLEVCIETGRTHQIRVHLHALGHPVLGDRDYGPRSEKDDPILRVALKTIDRQALHAAALSLYHPGRDEFLTFEAPLPADMAALIEALESLTVKA